MCQRVSFLLICLIFLFQSSCVSKEKYVQLESQLLDARTQMEELDYEAAQLSGTVDEMKENLDHARSEIWKRDDAIGDLTMNLSDAEILIDRQSNALGDLRSNLGQAESMIQEKDSNIARLRTDLGRTREEVREKERTIMELDRTRREIEHSLKKQIAQKDVRIEEIEGKLKVTFVDKILFDSGSTQVKEEGQQALMSLAESLVANTDETIIVEGHTDNVKIAYPLAERFPTNWELSTARAASVVRFLQEEASIEPERLTATGYGYYRPVAPNDSEESRRQNRRIEIILTPSRGGEPHRF